MAAVPMNSESLVDMEHDIAPPAAPMEYGEPAEDSESLQASAEKIFRFLMNPDNFVQLFHSLQSSTRELLGDERYEVVALYALPVTSIFLWTLFVYIFAYFRGRASKESVLVSIPLHDHRSNNF